jgi:hypothetical protein
MAKAFQAMLERYDVSEKVLGINADNASANDTQMSELDVLDNSFKEAYRARCFNHTLQLSVKTLLKPFNTALFGKGADDDNISDDEGDDQPVLEVDDECKVTEKRCEVTEERREATEEDGSIGDEDNGIDELERLDEGERRKILEKTAAICATVSKVCKQNELLPC